MKQSKHQKEIAKQKKYHETTTLQEKNSKETYCPKGAIAKNHTSVPITPRSASASDEE